MSNFFRIGDVQPNGNRIAFGCTSGLPTSSEASFAETTETKEKINRITLGGDAESSLPGNVTPPALRSDGVTFPGRLLCMGEVGLQKGKKSGWISAKDIECLKFIGEQGTVTVDQIWRRNGIKRDSQRHLYRRVEFWMDGGLVRSFAEGRSHQRFLSITRRAAMAVKETMAVPILLPPPPRAELPHTLALTEFRLAAVAAGKATHWVPDRALRIAPNFPARLGNYCPDAYWVTPSGRRLFLEYERTRKTKARRKEKYEHFAREMGRSDKYMDMVVWVADGASLQMMEEIIRISPNQKVFSTENFFNELARKATS